MITAQEIEATLQAAFPDAQVRVVDTTGTFDHFDAEVVSESFRGLSRIRQHQAVYAALGDAMRDRIHALALKTSSP
jgi:stress-induced morphogen